MNKSDPVNEAMSAYWRFFEGTNSRDSAQMTGGLNYPHARISARGKPGIAQERAAHAARMTFDAMLETGWDHTIGAEPEVLHASNEKVHIRGGWTRYNRDDEPIMSNEVCYIMTRTADGWGVQSRFGTDSQLFWGKPEDRPVEEVADLEANRTSAEQVLLTALAAMGTDNEEAAGCFHDPYLMIDAGSVDVLTKDDLPQRLPSRPATGVSVAAIQVGATGVNLTFDATFGDRTIEGLAIVVLSESDHDRWSIRGSSII